MSEETPHDVEIAALATRVHLNNRLGAVDEESLHDDIEAQFGTRDIDEATRRVAVLNQWMADSDE